MVEGYKNTEVGIIPNDWDVIQIGTQIDLLTGFPFQSNKYCSDGIKLLRGSNVKRGITDWSYDNTKYWEKVTIDLKQYLLQDGDIVIAMDGSLVGRSFARISKKDLPALLLQRVARVRSNQIDIGYLKEFICGDYFTKHCDLVKTTSAIPHISPKDIKTFTIPIPPTKAEQTAIATVLNDTDALINQLERLLTKKRDIKTGAMQELMKPKEGWEVKVFGDEVAIQGGSQPPLTTFISSQKEGYVRLIQIRDYKTEKYETYIPRNLAKKFCKKDDIMIGRYGPPVFQILKGIEGAYNVALMKAVPSSRIHKDYLYHFLRQESLFVFIDNLSKRTAGQSGVDMKELKSYPLHLPSIQEQKQIARILSDMDKEIQKLEKKIEKYKMLKQSMMQSLLTGKIRLKK